LLDLVLLISLHDLHVPGFATVTLPKVHGIAYANRSHLNEVRKHLVRMVTVADLLDELRDALWRRSIAGLLGQ
jgi:hypothetical protein